MLFDWRLFEIADLMQPITLNISSLDARLPSRFLPNTTMEFIVSNLMIDDWINTTNVTTHYNTCNPHICTYTYTHRYNKFQVISAIVGLAGGLNIILKILAPFIVKIISSRLFTRNTRGNTESSRAIGMFILIVHPKYDFH
ncbi:unnamed protein product [Rotaria sp. Silwood2]|nr:unnamed protein product [Rotaria sp. Silwood2]